MRIAYECLMSLCASLCFGIMFHLRGKKLLFAGVGGLLGWFVFRISAVMLFSSAIPGYFTATVAIAIFSEVCARVLHAPVSVFLAVALIPLVPGGGIYRTMQYCISGTTTEALHEGINTIGIAGALAMGIVVVSSIARVILRHKEIQYLGRQKK